MIFTPVPIHGAFLVDLEPIADDRGSFARAFCRREFAEAGIEFDVVQCNLARSKSAGVVRGLHYQRSPADERKLVRCVAGSIFDVIADLRPDSPTFRQAWWTELDTIERRALLIPPGVAHGYQSLEDGTEVFYMTDQYYTPELETGVRFDDPVLGITWPLPAGNVSPRDRRWPLLQAAEARGDGA
jgi:dTDP-4-dehydrorhamnose 3,5-epimerase